MDSPETLFAKVFKGRYYRKTDPMTPSTVYSPSYGWRSIISARSLVKKGLIERVGNGLSISVWKDAWLPAQCPRPASGIGKNLYPEMRVNQLINLTTITWNLDLLHTLIVPSDVEIIRSIPISRTFMSDTRNWHFTINGKYTVKSGYRIQQHESFTAGKSQVYGPNCWPLQEFAWKTKCPRKLRHFLWRIVSGCLSVGSNLRNRGINCDTQCARCGFDSETVNHALFECPPALQVWALSKIPSATGVFPTSSIYVNLDYLFWRIQEGCQKQSFLWILWYIWKSRNDKVFSDLNRDPQAVLLLAESEAMAWKLAQIDGDVKENYDSVPSLLTPNYPEPLCFIDGSWKKEDFFAGLGWLSTAVDDEPPFLGIKNIRRSLSPLHAEVEALLWAMSCLIAQQKTSVRFATDCSDLLKMVTTPTEWPAFSTYLEDLESLKAGFSSFSLIHILRRQNSRADSLAKSARVFSFNIAYVNTTLSD